MDDVTGSVDAATSTDLMHALKEYTATTEDQYKTLMKKIKKLGDKGMADVVAMPTGDGLFGMGGGGLIGGLILGSLLRNNGNLFGGPDGAAAGAVLRSPPEQVQANMSIMQSLGAIDKGIAVSTATIENSNSQQTNMLSGQLSQVAQATVNQITGVKEAVNAGAMVLAQQLNGLEKTTMENRYALSQDITADGDKTRALLVQQYEAALNRQLSDANARVIALEAKMDNATSARGVEVTTTNNINQMQQQAQQQAQFNQLAGLIYSLGQQIRSTNEAINVGSGTQTANPTNTNTNIR